MSKADSQDWQTASPQLWRTRLTLRRKRKTWRTKAARSSTGYSEQWSKKLREACDEGYCWKEQHITGAYRNVGHVCWNTRVP
jgi:hypothetical protein